MAEQEYQSNIPQNGAQNGQQSSIAGIVDDIVYQSEESGYVVCVIEVASSGDPITVVGTIPYLSEGDRITVQGDWVNHPTYGRQFKAVSYDKELPADQGDILRYLAGGNIKGIGPRTAQKWWSCSATTRSPSLRSIRTGSATYPGSRKRRRSLSASSSATWQAPVPSCSSAAISFRPRPPCASTKNGAAVRWTGSGTIPTPCAAVSTGSDSGAPIRLPYSLDYPPILRSG